MTNRRLPSHPNLENLRKQAKTLAKQIRARDKDGLARTAPYFAEDLRIGIKRAQLVVAREYGFASWQKMVNHVVNEAEKARNDSHVNGQDKVDATQRASSDRDIPVLPLVDLVVYPQGEYPMWVGAPKSVRAIEKALATDKQILFVAKRDGTKVVPEQSDLFDVGTVGTILQKRTIPDTFELPDGTVRGSDGTVKNPDGTTGKVPEGAVWVLVAGRYRATVSRFDSQGDYFSASIERLEDVDIAPQDVAPMNHAAMSRFQKHVELTRREVPPADMKYLQNMQARGIIISTATSAQKSLPLKERQRALEMQDVYERVEYLMDLMVVGDEKG